MLLLCFSFHPLHIKVEIFLGRPFKINDCLQEKILHSQNDFAAIYLKIAGLMTSPRCREEAEMNLLKYAIIQSVTALIYCASAL